MTQERRKTPRRREKKPSEVLQITGEGEEEEAADEEFDFDVSDLVAEATELAAKYEQRGGQ